LGDLLLREVLRMEKKKQNLQLKSRMNKAPEAKEEVRVSRSSQRAGDPRTFQGRCGRRGNRSNIKIDERSERAGNSKQN
jgi:hypothetical protein